MFDALRTKEWGGVVGTIFFADRIDHPSITVETWPLKIPRGS